MFNKEKDTLSVIIPVYNEEKAIQEVFSQLHALLDTLAISYEIIAVNDCSSDGSLDILKKIQPIVLLHNPYNLGYGASLKRGLRQAKGNWVLIIDSDGSYPIENIPDLLQYANDYDMVVGNRNQGADVLGRAPAKWILKKLAGFLTGHKIPDLNSGMRIFRKDLAMEFFGLYPSRFSFTTTITLAFFDHDYTVKYVSIPYHKRVGKSSIRPWHFFDFLGLIFKLILYFRPLKMLIIPILLIFAIGFTKGILDIHGTGKIGNFELVLVLSSFQIFVMALILEIFNKKNRR